MDDTGRSGSVEHTITARLTSAGQIHVTDLLLGDETGGSGLRPTVSAQFKGDILHGYVELHSDAAEPLRAATITFEVANGEFVRITGYLARRRDLERVDAAKGVRHSSTVLGAGSFHNAHLDDRTVQRVRSTERDASPRR